MCQKSGDEIVVSETTSVDESFRGLEKQAQLPWYASGVPGGPLGTDPLARYRHVIHAADAAMQNKHQPEEVMNQQDWREVFPDAKALEATLTSGKAREALHNAMVMILWLEKNQADEELPSTEGAATDANLVTPIFTARHDEGMIHAEDDVEFPKL